MVLKLFFKTQHSWQSEKYSAHLHLHDIELYGTIIFYLLSTSTTNTLFLPWVALLSLLVALSWGVAKQQLHDEFSAVTHEDMQAQSYRPYL